MTIRRMVIASVGDDHRKLSLAVLPMVATRFAKGSGRAVRMTAAGSVFRSFAVTICRTVWRRSECR
jgi:hypothetical protein